MPAERITLIPDGPGYLLRRIDSEGAISEIFLSEDNVISLALSARHLQGKILEQRTPKGGSVAPKAIVHAGQVELNTDVLKTSVLLTMFDAEGTEVMTFALPRAIAQRLAVRLPVRLAELLSDASTKQ
jgi:hypothetical protein